MKTETISPKQLKLLAFISSRKVEDEIIDEVNELIVQKLKIKLDEEMERLWEERGWDANTIEQWSKEHMLSQVKPK